MIQIFDRVLLISMATFFVSTLVCSCIIDPDLAYMDPLATLLWHAG